MAPSGIGREDKKSGGRDRRCSSSLGPLVAGLGWVGSTHALHFARKRVMQAASRGLAGCESLALGRKEASGDQEVWNGSWDP